MSPPALDRVVQDVPRQGPGGPLAERARRRQRAELDRGGLAGGRAGAGRRRGAGAASGSPGRSPRWRRPRPSSSPPRHFRQPPHPAQLRPRLDRPAGEDLHRRRRPLAGRAAARLHDRERGRAELTLWVRDLDADAAASDRRHRGGPLSRSGRPTAASSVSSPTASSRTSTPEAARSSRSATPRTGSAEPGIATGRSSSRRRRPPGSSASRPRAANRRP